MTRFQAEQECIRRNRVRDVTNHSMIPADAVDFWQRCGLDGNILINGGSEQQRTTMLIHMLQNYRKRTGDAVILLTGSAVTLQAVTNAAISGTLGKAVVSSPQYANYLPLFHMDVNSMSRLLISVARQKGYGDTDRMESYIKAFIAIAAKYHTPSLQSLQQLDRQYPENSQLVRFGEMAGIASSHIDALRAYPAGTPNLRNILNDLSSAYRNITSASNAAKANMLTAIPAGSLMCIYTASPIPDVMDLALAAELEQLLSTNRRFLLVLCDVPLISTDGLYRQVNLARNVCGQINVGICTHNVSAWAGAVNAAAGVQPADAMLKNTQKFVHINSYQDNDGDVESIFKYLGTYPKYEVQLGGGHGAEPIPIFHHSDWHVGCVGPRSRVEPEEMRNRQILLKGHDGRRIHLYRSITM